MLSIYHALYQNNYMEFCLGIAMKHFVDKKFQLIQLINKLKLNIIIIQLKVTNEIIIEILNKITI